MSISTISTAISVFSLKAFSGGGKDGETDATSLINTGTDSPLFGTSGDDRPMWNWIVSSDEYLEKYHETLKETCMLRAQSIRLQLDGELSTISDEQDSGNQVDASSISIKAMGKQNQDKF